MVVQVSKNRISYITLAAVVNDLTALVADLREINIKRYITQLSSSSSSLLPPPSSSPPNTLTAS